MQDDPTAGGVPLSRLRKAFPLVSSLVSLARAVRCLLPVLQNSAVNAKVPAGPSGTGVGSKDRCPRFDPCGDLHIEHHLCDGVIARQGKVGCAIVIPGKTGHHQAPVAGLND